MLFYTVSVFLHALHSPFLSTFLLLTPLISLLSLSLFFVSVSCFSPTFSLHLILPFFFFPHLLSCSLSLFSLFLYSLSFSLSFMSAPPTFSLHLSLPFSFSLFSCCLFPSFLFSHVFSVPLSLSSYFLLSFLHHFPSHLHPFSSSLFFLHDALLACRIFGLYSFRVLKLNICSWISPD